MSTIPAREQRLAEINQIPADSVRRSKNYVNIIDVLFWCCARIVYH